MQISKSLQSAHFKDDWTYWRNVMKPSLHVLDNVVDVGDSNLY